MMFLLCLCWKNCPVCLSRFIFSILIFLNLSLYEYMTAGTKLWHHQATLKAHCYFLGLKKKKKNALAEQKTLVQDEFRLLIFYTNKPGYGKKWRILHLALISCSLCIKEKKVGKDGENWKEQINEQGLMSAKYSQRSQCPHLGTSTTQQDTDRQKETGREGRREKGRKKKKEGR